MDYNPFTMTFGRHPERYITRYESTDMILDAFSSSHPVNQIYMIEGVRGTGKTVLMTTISQKLGSGKDWIVADLNSARNLLDDLAHRLYDSCGKIPKFLDKGFSVSVAGAGFGVSGGMGFQDNISVISRLLDSAAKNKKRVLITIDEVMHNKDMREFASQFQIWLRQDYPVFLLMTGLYENIYAIQNDPGLTFLLRSPKVTLEPLSIRQIALQYAEVFAIDDEKARGLADITKGYAFAFQALGNLYWENRDRLSREKLLLLLDALLEDFTYRKIWDSLSGRERDIILCIREDKVKIGDIREALSMSSGTLSKYREKLIKGGILSGGDHGYVSLVLPRFYEVVSML